MIRRYLTGFALICLSACSSLPQQTTGDEHWSVTGKVGLWANGEQESANIDWQDCNSHYLIRLSGPLGVGTTLIYGDTRQVSLHRGGDPAITAESPEALLASLGWIMPVSALRFWLRGQADPDAPYQRSPQDTDSLQQLKQFGWTIDYHPAGDKADRIAMERDDVRLKWILRNWSESAACPKP